MCSLEVEAPLAEITPAMQAEMRTEKRKNVKRGRKKGSGKKSKQGGKLRKKHSKRSILKAASPKKAATPKKLTRGKAKSNQTIPDDGETTPDTAHPPAKRARRKATAKSEHEIEHVFQPRIGTGKKWVYQVLENQKYGCRSCRFIYNGCHHCRNPKFKGKNAEAQRQEQVAEIAAQQHHAENQEEALAEPIAPTLSKPSKKRKSRKSNKC
jgi:hypothetical protein